MNVDTILRLLKNSGFNVLGADSTYVYLEDPSCILRSFSTFVEYAWVIISVLTMFLLAGWGISKIRGAKNDLMINIRNLTIMFGTLSLVVPILNAIYGADLFARGCRTIQVSIAELNVMLDARNEKLKAFNPDNLYEEFDIYDSGVITADTTYADAPLAGAGNPVTVDSDDEFVSTTRPQSSSYSNQYTDTENHPDVDLSNQTDSASQTTSKSANSASPATRATAAGKRDVVYTHADGRQYRRTGGTRAWRNQNPGNIRYSEFSRRMGAIGTAGGFAVFPDEETGMRAISELMRTDTYSKLTIAGAISRYAPPSENNTAGYHRRIGELTGLSINRRVSDLNDDEIARIASAIRVIEGWETGTTTEL